MVGKISRYPRLWQVSQGQHYLHVVLQALRVPHTDISQLLQRQPCVQIYIAVAPANIRAHAYPLIVVDIQRKLCNRESLRRVALHCVRCETS